MFVQFQISFIEIYCFFFEKMRANDLKRVKIVEKMASESLLYIYLKHLCSVMVMMGKSKQ